MKSVTVELPEAIAAALNATAAIQHHDLGVVVHDAVEQYLAMDDSFRREIEAGLREAASGDLVDHAEVVQHAASWTRKISQQ